MSYQEEAFRTAPSPQDLEQAYQRFRETKTLDLLLADVQRDAQRVDIFKKHIFYGKRSHIEPVWPVSFPAEAQSEAFLHLLHALLGMISEVGEIIEAVELAWKTGDTRLLAEELGDLNWYRALAASAVGLSLEQIDRDNIAKLTIRYPNRFSTEDAIRRRDREVAYDSNIQHTRVPDEELTQASPDDQGDMGNGLAAARHYG